MIVKIKILFILLIEILLFEAKSQMTLTMSSTQNSKCDGFGCNYSGPSILINEVMIAPLFGNGSIFGIMPGSPSTSPEGEWIELYNPDKCKSVDISCYLLGNNAPSDIINAPGGYVIPENTIVPPNGFCVIRGRNATPVASNLLVQNGGKTVEIIVDVPRVCIGGGTRLWFPDNGGWFAFYNKQGVVQDAISWNIITNSCMSCEPCNPGGCIYSGSLASYDAIPVTKKNYISNNPPIFGFSYHRMPDGGNWEFNNPTNPTQGDCNGTCIIMPPITCNGTATVTVQGGTPPYTYSWSQGYMQTTNICTGLCEGICSVTVTDANGISATSSIMVNLVNFDAQINIISPIKCFNESNGVASAIAVGGTSPYSYLWNTNPINSNQTISGLSVGNYMVNITDSNGCIDSASVTLTQPSILIAQTELINPIKCFNESNGIVNSIVTGGTLPYSYLWNTNPINTNQTASNLPSGNYMIMVTDANGCKDSSSISLYQPPEIIVNINSNNVTCKNYCNGSIQIEILGGILPYNCNINGTPYTNYNIISNLCDGIYIVSIIDSNQCLKTNNVNINFENYVNASFNFTPNTGFSPLTCSFQNTSINGQHFLWDFGNGDKSVIENPIYTFENDGNYNLLFIVTSPEGCIDSANATIIVLLPLEVNIPNVFTPNCDGVNELFFPNINLSVDDYFFTIYNRWGILVFESKNQYEKWDGKHLGADAAQGVYYYILNLSKYNQAKELRGSVTLMR